MDRRRPTFELVGQNVVARRRSKRLMSAKRRKTGMGEKSPEPLDGTPSWMVISPPLA